MYIKKLVIKGFKSFPTETEIIFDKAMNVIVGPNGSGKSNISDAICFVLGRLSIKSIRAAKAANLIFLGTKSRKPAHEASVEIVFDNSSKTFSLPVEEVSVKRIVRQTGQSIYKINQETKTRQEILDLLSQAGVDPYGFNIILQGEISSLIKMHPEERMKIIEEVAGISVYESRKEKSLKELEKTEERLKEVTAILRERNSYLKNLEEEKEAALKFKQNQETIKKCKASILSKKLKEKQDDIEKINQNISKKNSEAEKIRARLGKFQEESAKINETINRINLEIQKSSGLEQEKLHNEVADLRAEIAGLSVKKENSENRIGEIERRCEELKKQIPEYEREIKELAEKSPALSKKQVELKKKKEEFEKLEDQRKKAYSLRSELLSGKERLNERKGDVSRLKNEISILLAQIEQISYEIEEKDINHAQTTIKNLRETEKELENKILSFNREIIASERQMASGESENLRLEKIKKDIDKLDICPLCKTKITEQHKGTLLKEIFDERNKINNSLNEAKKKLEESRENYLKANEELKETISKTRKKELEIIRLKTTLEKHEQIKRLSEGEKAKEKDLGEIEKKISFLEKEISKNKDFEERYVLSKQSIEELSEMTEENIDTILSSRERELERIKKIIKDSLQEKEEIEEDSDIIASELEEKIKSLRIKEKQEEELNKKFKKMFNERNILQEKTKEIESLIINTQHEIRKIEDEVNNVKIDRARVLAEKETIEIENEEYGGIAILQLSLAVLEEKMARAKEILDKIGSINMRALEVYEQVKKEYDEVNSRCEKLVKEKEEIMKIIEEIDKKKRKAFIKTLEAINNLFTRNCLELNPKWQEVFLEIENKEDVFGSGINVIVKLGKGKYFDISSLSGGEQTLVALSLIFAIQEYKPYPFYILDEIDAALDKRNSERLSMLLKKHIKSGQYIIITHNDAVMLETNILYGVTMQEGISKILSLRI